MSFVHEKKNQCWACKKVCYNSADLRNHYRQFHMKVRRFHCKMCDVNWSYLSGIKKHFKLKHNITDPDEMNKHESFLDKKLTKDPTGYPTDDFITRLMKSDE